jgi:4'-phosphopantetheinyl transferase
MSNHSQHWNNPPDNLQLRADEVHVWRASIEASESGIEYLERLLSKDEVTKALRFHFEKDRKRWIVSQGILRILLSRYVNTDPSQLRLGSNPYGKPFLAFPSLSPVLHFNLSHSDSLALYAFSYSRQIGIDVEYKRTDIDYDSLANVSFSPNEQALLHSLPNTLKRDAFFNCWTRKEAYVKAKGKGFSIPINQFDVTFLPGEPAALLQSREDPQAITRWSFQELTPGTDYAGALAVEGTKWSLSCWNGTNKRIGAG